MHRGPRPAEDAPRPADVTGHQTRDRRALLVVGTLVHEDHRLAAAFVDRSGPVDVDREVEPGEVDLVEVALLDVPRPTAFALPGRRRCVEVARAAVIAIACDHQLALQRPGHGPSMSYLRIRLRPVVAAGSAAVPAGVLRRCTRWERRRSDRPDRRARPAPGCDGGRRRARTVLRRTA